MLSSHDTVTMVGVNDVTAAKRFFQETLGFRQYGRQQQ